MSPNAPASDWKRAGASSSRPPDTRQPAGQHRQRAGGRLRLQAGGRLAATSTPSPRRSPTTRGARAPTSPTCSTTMAPSSRARSRRQAPNPRRRRWSSWRGNAARALHDGAQGCGLRSPHRPGARAAADRLDVHGLLHSDAYMRRIEDVTGLHAHPHRQLGRRTVAERVASTSRCAAPWPRWPARQAGAGKPAAHDSKSGDPDYLVLARPFLPDSGARPCS